MPIKVIVADDHPLMVEGLRRLLEKRSPDIEVAGEAADGQKFLELAQKTPADIYLLDIVMPVLNGLDAAGRLLALDKNAKVIFLSMYDDGPTVEKAMKLGAKGPISALPWPGP